MCGGLCVCVSLYMQVSVHLTMGLSGSLYVSE